LYKQNGNNKAEVIETGRKDKCLESKTNGRERINPKMLKQRELIIL